MEKLNRREFMTGIAATLIASNQEASTNTEANEFPSAEAITETIEKLLAGREVLRVEKFKDEQKVIVACDITFALADGETALLEYMRQGRHDVMGGSSSSRTNIYVMYFAGDMPAGGTNVAEYSDGEWKVVADI